MCIPPIRKSEIQKEPCFMFKNKIYFKVSKKCQQIPKNRNRRNEICLYILGIEDCTSQETFTSATAQMDM